MRISLALLPLPAFVTATLRLMVRDGPVTDDDFIGYLKSSYQAIRYEPLCGTLGADARFKTPFSLSGRCTPPMEAFSNNSADHLAFYDTTGVRLKNAVVGGGTPLCMCFSLSPGGSGGIIGDICIWVDGTAQAEIWWSLSLDSVMAGDYRPGALKSLPQCAGVDLDGLKATWSATAAQQSVAEAIKTLSNIATAANTQGKTQTETFVSTFTPQGTLCKVHWSFLCLPTSCAVLPSRHTRSDFELLTSMLPQS